MCIDGQLILSLPLQALTRIKFGKLSEKSSSRKGFSEAYARTIHLVQTLEVSRASPRGVLRRGRFYQKPATPSQTMGRHE
jgi:hypothetical protein